MSSNNVNQVRKCVKAEYNLESKFRIPRGIDLEGEGVKWGVKWNQLIIYLPSGEQIKVEPEWDPKDFDFKHPDKQTLDYDCDWERCEGCDKQFYSDELSEDNLCKECELEKRQCNECGEESDDLIEHPFGGIRLCESCSVDCCDGKTPRCPIGENCEWCDIKRLENEEQ